jgi:hypothetical protein
MPRRASTTEEADEVDSVEESPEAGSEAKEKPKAQRSEAKEEADFQKTANAMKANMDAEPKVGVYIPLEQGEPKGTQLPVEINGYRMNVPKGVPNVQVPASVAEIIWRALGVYEEASAALRSPNDPNRPLRTDLQREGDKAAINA